MQNDTNKTLSAAVRDIKDKLTSIHSSAIDLIASSKTVADLTALKVRFTGKSGELTSVMRGMKDVSAEERPLVGKIVNDTREQLEAAFFVKEAILKEAELKERLQAEKIDITVPALKQMRGALHPHTLVRDKIIDIFLSMGYSIEEGREIETDYYNFTALNTPADHPARDAQDTIYISDNILLRSQTSTTQVRRMETGVLPIKMLNPGRVYRADEIDATHSPMFHQIEGLVVDKGITMCDLKGTLDVFVRQFFGENTKTRLRPSFFPFTEPSIEVDATCSQCGGAGCRVCKHTGWIEIMGAGIVNKKVLEMSGIDSNVYSGFAFGMGLDRITNIKYGITDLRIVFENDIKFLKQFQN